MKNKIKEQSRTDFLSVQRLRPLATAKVLMLFVLLLVSVQGAWALTGTKINNVWYWYNSAANGMQVIDVDNNATEVEIPETVELNGNIFTVRGFYDCKLKDKTNLKKVTIQAQMLMLEGEIFAGNTSIETVILPGSITYVRGAVFSGCTSLKRVMIPSGLPQVSGSLFSGCTSLVTIDIREGVTSIDASAFDGCTSLESVNVPSTITSIGNYAFRNCSSLRSIDVPAGVTTLNKGTFNGCTSLANVNLHEGLQSIADETVFEGAGLTSLHIPSTLNADDAIKFKGCVATLTSITLAPNHPDLSSPENSNAIMRQTGSWVLATNELILGCKNTVIPNGATIGSNAFNNCIGLQTLVLPKSVTINGSAFAGCTNLKTIICTGYDPSKYTFNDGAFNKLAPKDNISVLVPQSVVNTFNNHPNFRNFKAVEVDPSTIMNGFISDLELYIYPTYHLQIPLEGKVANTSNSQARLAYNVSSRLSTAITDVRFVKSSYSPMPSELTIDGKKYTRGTSYVLNLGSKNYSVYYTTDGSNAPGTPLLKRLEIDDKNYTTPMTSKDYIRGVEIDQSGKVISQTPNPDWNENSPVNHYYIYVKAFYEPYSVPANEIHYTTSDNKKLNLASNAFGTGYTTHDYSNGEGVLKFNEPVTDELAAAFANQTKLTYVMLPAGITGISNGAFSGCTSLSGVMASGKLYRIGDDAFKNCVNLEKASLADWGVTNIGTGAFEGCTGLQNVTIPSSIKSISANAFKGCSNITKLTVSDKLESIGESTFEDCAKLTAFDIPYGAALKTIGSKAFKNTGFGYLNMANAKKLTDLGTYAFAGCQNLYMVRIGSLDRIPAYLFNGSRLNISFTVENYNGTMTDVDANAFDKSKIEHIELLNADNVTAIPDNKFKDYTALKYFNFWGMRNLTSIGKYAFYGTILGSVNLAACGKLKSIDQYAFANNSQMSRLELPSSLEEIQNSVFERCTSLTTVNLPESIKTISTQAFYSCM